MAGALGVAGLGFAFVRWRRASAVGSAGLATAGTGPAGQALGVAGQGLAGQGLGVATVPPSASASAAADGAFQERLFDVGEEEQPVELAQNQGPSPARPLYRRVAPLLGAVLIVVAGALWLVGPVVEPKTARRHRYRWSYRSRRGTATGRHARCERPGRSTGRLRRGFGR